jgi:pimeloyl-ACP methyl ester carboxylesterase
VRSANIDPPQEIGERDGLAYARFMPDGAPLGGVVILHGAGSRKESHYDYARRLRAHGLAAIAFDQRGHGDSTGPMDTRMAGDVATAAALLGPGPVALRGSSMGAYVALVAAERAGAAAVVAICPASASGLRAGLRARRLPFAADDVALDAFLAEHDELAAACALACPVLLLHAEGDEIVPIAQSAAIAAARDEAGRPTRLVRVPGGDHRSVQHDDELQDLSVRFILRALQPGGQAGAGSTTAG